MTPTDPPRDASARTPIPTPAPAGAKAAPQTEFLRIVGEVVSIGLAFLALPLCLALVISAVIGLAAIGFALILTRGSIALLMRGWLVFAGLGIVAFVVSVVALPLTCWPEAGISVRVLPDQSRFVSRGAPSQEYVCIANEGDEAVNLKKWTLSDDDGTRPYEFPDFRLPPGRAVKVHTGEGVDAPPTDLYWNRRDAVWNDPPEGDTVVLARANGERAAHATYKTQRGLAEDVCS